MITIKKGDSGINVAFRDQYHSYTNKLFARNIILETNSEGDTLDVDFTHYSKKKRNTLEDSDFEKLQKQSAEISHFIISDDTVNAALSKANVINVRVRITDKSVVVVSVKGYEAENGFLR